MTVVKGDRRSSSSSSNGDRPTMVNRWWRIIVCCRCSRVIVGIAAGKYCGEVIGGVEG